MSLSVQKHTMPLSVQEAHNVVVCAGIAQCHCLYQGPRGNLTQGGANLAQL